MSDTYWCRACGTEASTGGRCPACGADELALLPFPALADDAEAVGFELVDWAAPERADLVAWLVASRIPHRLDGESVSVDPADESRTDSIIDWVTSPERPGSERVPAEQMRTALVALRRACKSMERDPGLVANPDLLDEIESVLDLGVPAGWPLEAWYEVRLLTDKIVNEGADAPDALLIHWARRVAWLIRVEGDGSAKARPRPKAQTTGSAPETVKDPLSWCPGCLFDGVSMFDHCPRCARQLVKSTVPALPESDPDDDSVLEVEYKLDDWDHDQRSRLLTLLFDNAVSHRFEGDDSLIVGGDDETLVDALVDEAAAPPAPVPSPTGGPLLGPLSRSAEPEPADALERLLDASRTVARTPSAAEAPEFTQAALDVLTMNAPDGVDRDAWEDAAQLAHSLLHGDPADSATAANRAASLVRLLTPWVAAAPDSPDRGARDQDELVYELGDWPAEQRDQLTLALEREGVEHSWENETDLIIDGRDESRIDVLLDEAEGPDEPITTDEVAGGEDDYQAISDLFGVCDRLARRPSDKVLRADAADAAAAVDHLSIPYGVADSDWWQLRTRARELAAGLRETDPDDSVIAEQAATLRDLLRGFL